MPGRFVLAYGNIPQGPWEWSATPEFRGFVSRRFTGGNDMPGLAMAFDVPGSPEFPNAPPSRWPRPCRGQPGEALPSIESGLGIARQQDEPHLTGGLLAARSFALYLRGDHAGAMRDAHESVLLYRQAGDRRRVGTMLGSLGYAELARGELGAARTHLEDRWASPARSATATAWCTGRSTSAWPSTSAARWPRRKSSSPNHPTWPGACG